MRFVRLAFVIATLLCLGGFALAQPTTPRQNGRQQQRAAALIQGILDGAASQSDPTQLVFRKDVQHDLLLELAQRGTFDRLHDRQQADLQQARMQNRRNPVAVSDLQAQQKKETQAKIDELLTSRQKARLAEIAWQVQGNQALFATDLQKKLNLSDEQKTRITQIKAQRDQQIAEMQANASQGTVVFQEVSAQFEQVQSDTNGALSEVLTPEQSDQFKKLLGPPFKAG